MDLQPQRLTRLRAADAQVHLYSLAVVLYCHACVLERLENAVGGAAVYIQLVRELAYAPAARTEQANRAQSVPQRVLSMSWISGFASQSETRITPPQKRAPVARGSPAIARAGRCGYPAPPERLGTGRYSVICSSSPANSFGSGSPFATSQRAASSLLTHSALGKLPCHWEVCSM